MEKIVQEELNRLMDLEPEILVELVKELNLYLGAPMRGYAYLMGYSTGYYKLGFAKTPPSRRQSLVGNQQGLKIDIWVIHIIETDDMKRLEEDTAAKLNLDSKYVGNEMWDLTQDDIALFCSINSCFYGNDYSRQAFIF